MITELDFARILLRYTFLSTEEITYIHTRLQQTNLQCIEIFTSFEGWKSHEDMVLRRNTDGRTRMLEKRLAIEMLQHLKKRDILKNNMKMLKNKCFKLSDI